MHVGLHQVEFPSPSLVYFTDDIGARLDLLDRNGIELVDRRVHDGRTVKARFEDPNGQALVLVDPNGATTLTYFATDMVARIAAVEAQGIPLAWSQENKAGETALAQIETPDGQPVFLFQGEGEAFG